MFGNTIKKLAALTLTSAVLVSFSVQAAEVTGAGASFPAPLYSKWADTYQKKTGHKINYQSMGSGAGVKQIIANTVDFGATDAPMKPDKLKENGLVQFPTVIGGVVPVVNLKGIESGQLRLTPALLADIFLGKIAKWNDPAIAALNKNLNLPDAPIAVVRRSDGSGTSFVFTNYLSKVSEEWKNKVGEGSTVDWPTGLGGKGNEGVSAFVRRVANSIGYVEYVYAQQSKMTTVILQNADGFFVEPGDENFQAAAKDAQWDPESFYAIITNQPGKNAWPISCATFILMRATTEKPAQSRAVLDFFEWAFSDEGTQQVNTLSYVALPEALRKKIKDEAWGRIVDGRGNRVK
jgi:phosphate transport system substrate-binding protein